MRDGQVSGVSTTPLAKVADTGAPIVYGIVQPGPDTTGGVPFVQSRDVGGIIDVSSMQRTSPEIAAKYRRSKIETGDILFSLRGNIGQSSLAPNELDGANIARGIARIRVGKKSDTEFVRYVLQGPVLQKLIARNANGSTFRELSIEELRKLPIPDVSLPEQRKIAAILRTWDEALEKLNALRAAKARQLDGLAAKLIHDEQVERLHLRGFLKEKSTRNRDEQVQRVLSVTNSAGFVLAEEQFAHRVASASLSNYKIVRRGQYAYNPSRINVGSIARLDAWDEGALSPMYVVFQVQGGLDADFFGHWLRSAEARQRIALAAQGSVRETVSFGDLGSILVPVPTIERQQAIAKGLNAAQAEISLLDDEIKAVTRQKRGLMQKLLTGEWRVEVSDDEEAAA
ncbi:restriction endonuclease subunit S [Thioclava sp. SK-1]|uniref:restriction endonuclease subunit S n=1 Tax=Thioclava sp. SK-1 TaxID=1889770 RepID=UPI0009F66287|nr:restriction endonuclease subunit S [Thioclava sp. SK-1]